VTYGLVGTLVAAEGVREELVRHLLDAAAVLADDPSCIQYAVGVSGESEVTVLELWVDEAAHDASLQRDDVRSNHLLRASHRRGHEHPKAH
jgi:quinol monooxygenase YgiN